MKLSIFVKQLPYVLDANYSSLGNKMGLITIAADQLITGVASRLIYEGSICDSWPCWNEGTCESVNNKNYTCHCTNAYTGQHCEIRVLDLCRTSECRPNALCTIGNFTFLCPEKIKELSHSTFLLSILFPSVVSIRMHLLSFFDFSLSCLTSACLNGGICEDTNAGHRCNCPSTFHGPFCQYSEEHYSTQWTIIETCLILLVFCLIICAIVLICCSYAGNVGVYVSVPTKGYNRWEEGDGSEEDDIIAMGELRKAAGIQNSRTRETLLDPEVGCSNPCVEAPAPVLL